VTRSADLAGTDRGYATELADEPGLGTLACLRLYRKLAAGVAVVTSRHGADPFGLTASSLTSVSLRPPLLLFCAATGSNTLAAIRAQRSFAVHLLRADQAPIAEAFARPGHDPRRFAGRAYRNVLGVPVLSDVLAWSVCFLVDERRYGDHCVVVGQVVVAHTGRGTPLIWHDRRFAGLAGPSGQGCSGSTA
jgi:flavin reductase (DIM6/NTAB) family NADH-FMN oxidoreductase RutF